jgi:hypothetical protein
LLDQLLNQLRLDLHLTVVEIDRTDPPGPKLAVSLGYMQNTFTKLDHALLRFGFSSSSDVDRFYAAIRDL